MSHSEPIHGVLRQWAQVVMTRSMHGLVRFVKEHDLTMAQFSTLMRLRHQERCGVTDVGSLLGISNAAASQLVDKLVQVGLLARTEDPEDRRVRRLALTPAGHALVESSLDARLGWTSDLPAYLAAHLSPERQAAVAQALRDLVAAAEGLEQPNS